jgi:UDP-glucose 4-epimerase
MFEPDQKIVVTGGAGFIGSHLVDRLLRDTPAQIVVLDNLSRGRLANLAAHRSNPRLECVVGDVRDAPTVLRWLRNTTLVYHIAAEWEDSRPDRDSDQMFTTNVVGTLNVLRAAVQQRVERVVFTSSYEAYGIPVSLPVDEGQPLLAIDFYGASKAAAEAYCRAFYRLTGLKTAVLRLSDVYGPRDSGHLVPTWLQRVAAGEDLEISDGKRVIDLVWIGLVVEALIRAATLDWPIPPVNVASGTGTRLIDLAKRIRHLTKGNVPIHVRSEPVVENPRFVASIDRMRHILGIEPGLDPLIELPSLVSMHCGGAP